MSFSVDRIRPNDPNAQKHMNPKVMERKMLAHTDWAQLVRAQQAIAEKAIQRENEQRVQKKAEWSALLDSMVNQKKAQKQNEEFIKVQDQAQVIMKKQDYEMAMMREKNEKVEIQKLLAEEYARERQMKDQDMRRRAEQEKSVEKELLERAIDSLEIEKMFRENQRRQASVSVERMMKDREAQKKMEREWERQSKEEWSQMVYENMKQRDIKDLNYKMFYNKISEKQKNNQMVYDEKVGQMERMKERQIENFIQHGVENGRRKIEEEERRRQVRRRDQVKDVVESAKMQIQEHQYQKMHEKMAYMDVREEQMRKSKTIEEYNDLLKQSRANNANEYKNFLQQQMKAKEEQRLKEFTQMTDTEKKLQLNRLDHMIPGIVNNKYEHVISPQIKQPRQPYYLPGGQRSTARYGSTPHLTNASIQLQSTSSMATPQGIRGKGWSGLGESQIFPTIPMKKNEYPEIGKNKNTFQTVFKNNSIFGR